MDSRKIVIGIESYTSEGLKTSAVVAWALANHIRSGDNITLVHASKKLEIGGANSPTGVEKLSDETLHEMENTLARIFHEMAANYSNSHLTPQKIEGIVVSVKIERGDPREVITRYAEASPSSTVIVGSRGVGAVKRAFLGSVSTHLVQNCSANVIIVKPN
ncbi:hypothetical protein BJ742DRAFT_790082 [Cladochytrium replicatum]|nr:hypothetical protein BJ742DRAFT_790082 [Cladochytrium replicatum]